MAYDTDASIDTSTGTKSHMIHLNNHPKMQMPWCHCWHHQHHVTENIIDMYVPNQNATYKPHVPVSSCAHETTLSYIYLL